MTQTNDPEFQRLLKVLQQYLASCGPDQNKHDRVHAIIGHCIIAQLNTKERICQMAKALGWNTRHVAKYLNDRTGTSPQRHDWYVDLDGRYWELEH
jgi:AraC-like DNA-binding protein